MINVIVSKYMVFMLFASMIIAFIDDATILFEFKHYIANQPVSIFSKQ